jgi:Phosphate-selective porin
VEGSFFLTGEKNSFKSVTPKKQFDPFAGGWGAFELVARYGELDFDDDAFPIYASPTASVTEEKAWAVGLNWHLGRNVKLMFNYEQTQFEGGATTGDRPDEKFFATRFQTSF